MKYFFLLAIAVTGILTASAQSDKSKRPSPPAQAKQVLPNGATLTIDYSQPSIKGREIGTAIEPFEGKIWRAGANEATVFEVSQGVKVNGQELPAGKYGFFIIKNGDEWTLIFNKTWNQWGAFSYKESEDALRIKVKAGTADPAAEKLTYTISPEGMVSLHWGEYKISFDVK
ncbi:MAG: DUF2911 domain-containing protein [Bacteroidetes bacterium]|nr:DUF2911 domain-containing protein [Bacteroidota bacterium]